MEPVQLLQELGLTQYEARAYLALLAEGPLTGYELGKRSAVPLSRSYEILERLAARGLALVQPGEPPRYAAAEPELFLAEVGRRQRATLDALRAALAHLARPAPGGELWIVRGREPVLRRLRALAESAVRSVWLQAPAAITEALADALDAAADCGCTVTRLPAPSADGAAEVVIALVDDQSAIVGTLAASRVGQCVVSANPGLVHAVRRALAAEREPVRTHAAATPVPTEPPPPADWVAWEDRKRRHLWLAASRRQPA